MPPRLLLPILLVLGLAGHAADPRMQKTPATAAPESELTTYYFGLITKGSNFNAYNREDRAKIQAAHLANIERLAQQGKLLVAGPFPDNGEWRGIFIFKCASLQEAQALAASDPAVQAGRLKVELHPWMTERGCLRDPEFPPAK
jgi:uncharacterized protein YciI